MQQSNSKQTILNFLKSLEKIAAKSVEEKPDLPRPPIFFGVTNDGTVAGLQINRGDYTDKGMNNIARRLFMRVNNVIAVGFVQGGFWRTETIDEQTSINISIMTEDFFIYRKALVYVNDTSGFRWWKNNQTLDDYNFQEIDQPDKVVVNYKNDIFKAENLLKDLLFGYLFYKLLSSLESKIKNFNENKKEKI